jgi:hypothetical protein
MCFEIRFNIIHLSSLMRLCLWDSRKAETGVTFSGVMLIQNCINHLAPNDVYIRRTAQLTSRRCILNVYSTNILTEYFKHAAHTPFFFSPQDAVYFITLSFLVPVIFTF